MAIKALSDSGEGMQSLYKGGLATRLLYGTQGTIGHKRERETEEKFTKAVFILSSFPSVVKKMRR